MAQLSLSLLGTFQVSRDDHIITRFRSSNVKGLLVYLALQATRPFPRDVLAALFWPDQGDRRARKNLRQTLYQLRKVLGDSDEQPEPFFHVSRQTVQFNAQSHVNVDVAMFLQALDAADLETAVTLYTGDLLPGFTCDSLEFEDWLRRERERLHGLALTAMANLTERQLRNGHVADAQATARRQLELAPWSESAYRHLIEALALAGDRHSALAQFERCREILSVELDLSPEPETVALIERIQKNELLPVDAELIAGRFALEGEIGRGSMGVVFRGRDNQTGATVAIKKLGTVAVPPEPGLVFRFQQEGEALRRLNHPNIVHILAMDEQDGTHYLVMEYIAGGDLRRRLHSEGVLPVRQALTIALDLADALTRAHRLHILHRDIKPGNVLLDDDGLPRLADFGLARLGHESLFTSHESILGTIAYLSPEACLAETLDGRSDIWSFGVLLYEMLLGDRPFSAATPAGLISQILKTPLPDILALRPEMPEALADLLYRMLAKSRTDRIPSVRLVGAQLEAILQAIEQQSGADQGQPTSALPSARPAFATPTPDDVTRVRHNLPAQPTPFVGREAELAELQRLLTEPSVRLVTILGPGGMGKTRLSLEVARHLAQATASRAVPFPDGIFFVNLATVTSVEQMFPAIATALRFAIDKELEPRQQIINYFMDKRALLLLDNFEQLLIAPKEGAQSVAAFLRGAPELQIMITSRQKLNLNGETIFTIEGLTFPDWQSMGDALNYSAVQLFVQSARRAQIDFQLDEGSLHHVAKICQLVEGMPLGLLLAAAWIDLLSLPEIVTEMQADVDFLENEMGNLPPRQRSMRAVFDYSCSLLTENENDVLAKLSIFQGGFTREAAQAVTGASLRQLLALVNKSLVQRDTESGRFALHELLRQLAAEKLAAIGKTEEVQTAHSQFYFQQLAETRPRSWALVTLTPDVRNLEAACLWGAMQGDASALASIIEPLHVFYNLSGREFELFRLWLKILSLLPGGDPSFQDVADNVTATRASVLNRLQESGYEKDEHDQAIDIDALYRFFCARGAKLDEAIVCQHLAYRATAQGDYKQALAFFQIQARLYEEENAMFRLASCLAIAATGAFRAGEAQEGLTLARRSMAVAEHTNDELNKLAPLIALGFYTLHGQLDYETADQQFAEVSTLGLRLWRQGLVANPVLIALAWRGFIALLQGKLARAYQFAQQMKDMTAIRNNPREQASAACFLGLVEATVGNYRSVDAGIFESVAIGHTTFASHSLILNACGLGNVRAATIGIVQAWSQPMAMRWPSVLLQVLPAAVFVLLEKGQLLRAASLLAAGRAHAACPRGWWEIMAMVQALDARLQEALSPEDYAAAQTQGLEVVLEATAASLLEEFKGMVQAER